MSGNVSTFLKISRLVNKPGDKAKSKEKSQSLELKKLNRRGSSGSANSYFIIYTVRFSTSEDLTASSVSTFSNSSISKILREIIQINFSYYIFFCFQRRATCFSTSSSSASTRRYWVKITRSCLDEIPKTLQPERFFRIYSIQRKESKGDISHDKNSRRTQ